MKRRKCFRGVFPSSGQIIAIVLFSVIFTFFAIASVSTFVDYRDKESAASKKTSEIISSLHNMKSAVRAFMSLYNDDFCRMRMNLTLTDKDTGDVIAEFYAQPKHSALLKHVIKNRYSYSSNGDNKRSDYVNIIADDNDIAAGDYIIAILNEGRGLYIGYKFDQRGDEEVKRRLTARARSSGLVKDDGKTWYHLDNEVYVLVTSLPFDEKGE